MGELVQLGGMLDTGEFQSGIEEMASKGLSDISIVQKKINQRMHQLCSDRDSSSGCSSEVVLSLWNLLRIS